MVSLKNSKRWVRNYTDIYENILYDLYNQILLDFSIKTKTILYITILNKKIKIVFKYDNDISLNNTVSGNYYPLDELIEITITYVNKKGFKQISYQILDCIRHEVQHVIQYLNKKYSKTLLVYQASNFNYYMNDSEIEAFIYGFIYGNKFNNCRTTLLEDFTKYISYIYDMSPIQKDILYKKYNDFFIENIVNKN